MIAMGRWADHTPTIVSPRSNAMPHWAVVFFAVLAAASFLAGLLKRA